MWARLIVILFAALCLSAHSQDVLDRGYEFPEDDELWVMLQGDGVYTTAQEQEANKKTSRIAKEIQHNYRREMARKANAALRGMIKIGVMNLERKGFQDEAEWLENGWRRFDGEIERIVLSNSRDIGSWKPLSVWLAMAYEVLEYKLGFNLCYALRLTDIKSLNFGLVVTFSPCEYGLDEFMKHAWTGDPKYRSVVPLVTYWVVSIGCSVSSFGALAFWACGPLGMLCELGMNKAVAPWLGPKIYDVVCN